MIDVEKIKGLAPSPAYVVDMGALRSNLDVLGRVQRESGANILLALKGFSMWSTFPLISKTLKGVCASSPWEARLGREEFGGQVHSFAAAFSERDIEELLPISDHLVFNSPNQLSRFKPLCDRHPGVSIGLRVNPEHSEGHTPIYDPCAPCSRLGTPISVVERLSAEELEGVDGFHCHTLCEQLFEPLARTATVVEERLGHLLGGMKWLNMGGGHHITREGYDIDGLVALVKHFRQKYGLEVYLEPGEAIAINTGVLVGTVLDVTRNVMELAILDISASCHMPDVLEMPYRPPLHKGFEAGEKEHTYRLGGPSCLAGDVIGDWSFEEALAPGDRVVFLDQAHYTMVKNTTFNGIRLPSICTYEPDTGELTVVREFGYEDFKSRLS